MSSWVDIFQKQNDRFQDDIDVTPAGQELLGHGAVPGGLRAAHAGGHRVLGAWSGRSDKWPVVSDKCESCHVQTTVKKSRPASKLNAMIE